MWVKVFKNRPSIICGRQSLKNLKVYWDMLCLSRPYPVKFFKGCLLQTLLGPILGTPTPPLLKRGLGPSKNWVTWGVGGGGTKFFCQREGINLKTWGGGSCHFLLRYSSVTFTLCRGAVRFPLLFFRSSVFWISHSRSSSKSLLY